MRIGAALPSPQSGTGPWLRANAPQIATPTFTGQAKFDVGTAAAPSASGPAGTSGLYVTATPTVGLALSGTSRMLIDASDITFPTTGSATAHVINMTTGNSGFGVAAHSVIRVRAVATSTNVAGDFSSDAGVAMQATSTSSYGIYANSTSNYGIYARSVSGTAALSQHIGALTGNTTSPTHHVQRASTLGAFTSTGPVILCEDTTASTGNLQRWVKQGADKAVLTPLGALVLGGGTISTKAILDLQSTTLAFLPPRMTTTERDAITSVPAGATIYNTTTNKVNVYTTAWEAVTSA